MNDDTSARERHTGMSDTTAQDAAGTSTPTGEDMEELLRAGAVLPPGTIGAGDRAVPMVTQTYRHPALDGRVVVRLVPAEDAGGQGAGFLGLEPEGEPVEVGVGQHRAMGFPEWVLVHRPSDGHLAMSLVEEMDKVARTVRTRGKRARAAYEAIGERLSRSVPHFLPTFYEQAGRVFLATGQTAYASQMFVNARKAETAYALPFDEARMDAVFLEFALADAVPTKILSSYAKGLSSRVPAATAFRHLRGLFVRLAAHGVPPSSASVTDLRRLMKAVAGKNALAEETAYLREMLPLPGTAKAPPAWWKAHRAALTELAREPAVRGMLLGLLPEQWEREELPQWLDLLERTGATSGLCDATLPAEERSPDGTAGWTHRFLTLCGADFYRAPSELYPLVARMADALGAELRASGAELPPPVGDVNLLDQLLSLDVPVAEPDGRRDLALDRWAAGEDKRDLLALAADARFRPVFLPGSCKRERATLAELAGSPGGRPMLADWVASVGRRHLTGELAEAPGALDFLSRLPEETLALAADAVREALDIGIAPVLARALRTGILDELGWPAWEKALRSAAAQAQDAVPDVKVVDAWPYLIVVSGREVRVIGAEGTVLVCEPQFGPDQPSEFGCQYVDGELFLWWESPTHTSWRGYWHGATDSPQANVLGDHHGWWPRPVDEALSVEGPMAPASLPLPEGGRTTAHGVLRRGDTEVPFTRARGWGSAHPAQVHSCGVAGDSASYWMWSWERSQSTLNWYTYDPATATVGPPGAPRWIDEALLDAPEGSTLESAWLLPAPSAVPGPVCAPVDGVLGWRVVRLPDHSRRGEDLSGRTVVLPARSAVTPAHALVFPGTDQVVAVSRHWEGSLRLHGPDGALIAEIAAGYRAGPFTAGTDLLPHLRYWHHLQPRDPQGSAALRRLDEDTAAALLTGAMTALEDQDDEQGKGRTRTDDQGELPALVRTLLPEVGHEALRAGIAGVVRFAAEQQRVLDALRARLDSVTTATAAAAQEPRRPAPSDDQLRAALNGVGMTERDGVWYGFKGLLFGLPRLVARSMRGLAEPAAAGSAHLSLPWQEPLRSLNAAALPELSAVVALRAASRATAEEHRLVLEAFLRELEQQELTELDPGHWRRVHLTLDDTLFGFPDHGYGRATILDLEGGAFLVFPEAWYRFTHEPRRTRSGVHNYDAAYHDPSGRFETPAPYTLVSAEPFVPGSNRPSGWAAALTARLAESGPASWRPEAADEFARLTGVTPTMARLVLAGMPQIDDKRTPVPSETLKVIGVKSADAQVAKDELRSLDIHALRAVVAALLPAEPSRLWTHGPDVRAAAEVWNERLGRCAPVPEDVLYEAVRSVVSKGWAPGEALRGFLDAAAEPRLNVDLTWTVGPYSVRSAEGTPGFDGRVLTGAAPLAAWLAHRLPAGHPIRAALPGVLTAIRDRLAHPGLLVELGRQVDLGAYRRAAGEPTESGEDFERYGAVVLSTENSSPWAAVRTALLDPDGDDPHLAALFPDERPTTVQRILRLVHDRLFAELLADPGDPVAGERDEDGQWWPQDPARSVPGLVGEAAERYGIGEDAAVLYLTLLAMPDPTDRNVARWTGWGARRGGTARLRAARAELAATDLVVVGSRAGAGRSLFLPGGWTRLGKPHLPLERWKLPMYDALDGERAVLGVVVPTRPVAGLYREAWRRVLEGDEPRLEEVEVPRPKQRRR